MIETSNASVNIRFDIDRGLIVFTDESAYTDLPNAEGNLVLTGPNSNVIFSQTIDLSSSLSVEIPVSLVDGNFPIGCYSIQYLSTQSGQIFGGASGDIEYDYERIVGILDVDVDCLRSKIDSRDLTVYPAGATLTRSHQLIPPGISDLTADAPSSDSAIFRSPIVTGTWSSKNSVVCLSTQSGYEVLETVESTAESLVRCDIDICKLFECVRKKHEEWISLQCKNPTAASNMESEVLEMLSLVQLITSSAECGKTDKLSKYYNDLKDLVSCECGCEEDESVSRQVIPLSGGSDGVVNGGVFASGQLTLTRTIGADVVIPGFPQIPDSLNVDVEINQVPPSINGLSFEEVEENVFEYKFGLFQNRTVFVDQKHGDDDAAARQRRDLPAKTIAKAEELAQDEDVIVIMTGAFNDIPSIGASLPSSVEKIHYHFLGRSALSIDSGQAVCLDLQNLTNVIIDGAVSIDQSGLPFCKPVADRTVRVDVDEISNCADFFQGQAGASGEYTLKANTLLGPGIATLAGGMNALIDVQKYTATGSSRGVESVSGWAGIAEVNIQRTLVQSGSSGYVVKSGGDATGRLIFNSNIRDTRSGSILTSPVLLFAGHLTLNGSLKCDSAKPISTSSSGADTAFMELNASVESQDVCLVVLSPNKNIKVNGPMKSDLTCVSIQSSGARLFISNRMEAGVSCVSNLNTSTPLFSGAVLISQGDFSLAGSGQFLCAGSMAANKPIASSLTNLTPSAAIVIDENIF